MNDAQIKHMVDRFLGWRLPETFNPDAGISYVAPSYVTPSYAKLGTDTGPTGTNVFDSDQATAMVRYMAEGLPEEVDVACGYCNRAHAGLKCPLVSAIEYDAAGNVKRVEFFREDYGPIAPQGPESDADYRKRLLANIGGTINANKVAAGTGDVLDEVGSYYNLPRRK